MAAHPDLPKNIAPVLLRKTEILENLKRIDNDAVARSRILTMETDFREKISTHIESLPVESSKFQRFNTNPFVLMFHSSQKSYSRVAQIEQDLVPAKAFSSMETSAGNMVEKVVLPVYGWEVVQSAMQSYESLLDGRKIDSQSDKLVGATLKSGPRTLNDATAKNISDELVGRASAWAVNHGVKEIDFTYGVLYGTKKQSNKKDWHILRNVFESRPIQSTVKVSHRENWSISYMDGPLRVSASVRVGIEWWDFLGGTDTWIELCCALIRSCIAPSAKTKAFSTYSISDLAEILDTSMIPDEFNVSLLQESQFEWLFFLARHFSDGFVAD